VPDSATSTRAVLSLDTTEDLSIHMVGDNTVDIDWIGIPQPFSNMDPENGTIVSGKFSAIPSNGSDSTDWTQATEANRPDANTSFLPGHTLIGCGPDRRMSVAVGLPLGAYTIIDWLNYVDISQGWGNICSTGNGSNTHAFWQGNTAGFAVGSKKLYMGHEELFIAVGPAGVSGADLQNNKWYGTVAKFTPSGTNNAKIYINNVLEAQGTILERDGTESSIAFNAYLTNTNSGCYAYRMGLEIFAAELTEAQTAQVVNAKAADRGVTLG
jgi:hypothetical protein